MTDSETRAGPSTLGEYLKSCRESVQMSLRDVEIATGNQDSSACVSNAYLSQLENGRIAKPSPNILHTLSAIYGAPYPKLMEKAGYISPGLNADDSKHGRAATYSVDNLTAEEERELLRYLSWFRHSRKSS